MTWLKKVEENTDKVGLKREDALDRAEWRKGVQNRAMRKIRPSPATGKTPNRNWTELSVAASTRSMIRSLTPSK